MTFSSKSTSSSRVLLYGIWQHLTKRRRIQLGLLLLMMLASGLAEVFSLAAVLPFLAVLSDPQRIWQQPLLQGLAKAMGITAAGQLLLPATVIFGVAAVLAAAVRLLNLWLNGRLAAAIGSDLSCEAYKRTLHQPYAVHVQRNSSSLITGITTQISNVVGVLNSTLQLFTSTLVAAGLLLALFVVDWGVALTAAVVFGVAYGLLAITSKKKLATNSALVADTSRQQMKALQEGLGAIRDVLLDGSQNTYLGIYQKADRPMRIKQAQSTFLGAFPRYGLEALGMLLIAALGLLLKIQRGDAALVIPLLGTLALGAQRLLPALQQIYGNWAGIRSSSAAVADVLAMLNQPMPLGALQSQHIKPLPLNAVIQVKNLSFSYGLDAPMVLQGLDLEIKKGERIGIIGSTGSGKSTLVDLLMGLLVPSGGQLLVDGVDIHSATAPERVRAWRASIAHVPQSIFLADSSIAENIAFGVPKEQINMKQVRAVAEQAQIAALIENSAEGYKSFVGERGIRLSGGQRQRIGIARALYKKASLLVFDEATSALDNATEQAVMEAVEGLSRDLTLVMIAHRLTTVANCDRIIELEKEKVASIKFVSELSSH